MPGAYWAGWVADQELYLVTAPGHEPDLQSNCCSRAGVVQEGSDRPSASVAVDGAPLEAANHNLRAQVGFLNVSCYGSALGDAWAARPLVVCAVGPGSREARPMLVIVARRTTHAGQGWAASAPLAGRHGRSRT